MRNREYLRYGLASMIVAGATLGAVLAACGDDENTDPGTGVDSGPGNETSTGDSSTDSSVKDAAVINFAKLTFINAATDLGPGFDTPTAAGINQPIRICFEQSVAPAALSLAPYPPLPDNRPSKAAPGIALGTGGTFPSFGLDLQNRALKPYIVSARKLLEKGVKNPGDGSPGPTCDEILGTKKAMYLLEENKDFFILPVIPADTFKRDKAYVIALTGCAADASSQAVLDNKTKCGDPTKITGAAGLGTLSAIIQETNRTAISATALGAQFFHASAQINAVFGPSPGAGLMLTPGFMGKDDGGDFDASKFSPAVPAPITYGTLSPAQGVTGVIDSDYFVLNRQNPAAPQFPLAPFPLPLIQALSGLGLPAAPTVYKNGANYVFIAVGDKDEPTFSDEAGVRGDGGDGTSFNTKSFHFLAFPTDPVVVPYSAN